MAKKQNPEWFTIKEAAAYLSVGEPTIYRWMREKRITFRKVGDSTRFLQEDLDALIDVHPSEKDLATAGQQCAACGADSLFSGHMQSTGLVYFRPKDTKFWTFKSGNINTEARMCSRCGHIAWYGNCEKLKSLRKEVKDDQ